MADSFLAGSSVHLFMQVSQPGTRTPADPAEVTLAEVRSIALDTGIEVDATPVDTAFTRVNAGLYTYVFSAGELGPARYKWVGRASDGQGGVALQADEFVVVPLP